MQIELPLTKDYVSDWGPWDAVREIIQNAKDEQELNGSEMTVTHDGIWLNVRNIGAELDRSALLIGKTSKKGIEHARGQFGEGLDLAFLVLARSGIEVICRTPTEKWIPRIDTSEEYNEEVLIVSTRKMKMQVSWVDIAIKIPLEDWEQMKPRFLFLDPPKEGEHVKTEHGTILFEDRHKGHVFVKGIFVALKDNISHGYDMNNVKLDRDRRVVDTFDLSWTASQMYSEAARRSDLMANRAYRMLRDGCEDVRYIGSMYVDHDTCQRIVKAFEKEHGENAMPVSSIAESREMEHAGIKGVIVDKPLRELIEREKGSALQAKINKGRDIKERFSWHDLIDTEQEILTKACEMVDSAVAHLIKDRPPIMNRLDVVTFNDPDVQGTAKNQDIRISRIHLIDLRETLAVLIHEEAHAMSLDKDMSKGHFDTTEEIWSYVAMAAMGL